MPAVKTGMTPPPMPGMPAPMQPMGGMPPMQNPFAPMPPMPLAGTPMPQPPMPMPPMAQGQMPQGQQQQMMGSTAGRRRRFGDALEGMLGRNQGIGAAMPQQRRPMPMPPMMPQQRMVAPGTPMMRTPTPRPMQYGGIVQGYAPGGVVQALMDNYGYSESEAQGMVDNVSSRVGDLIDSDIAQSYADSLSNVQSDIAARQANIISDAVAGGVLSEAQAQAAIDASRANIAAKVAELKATSASPFVDVVPQEGGIDYTSPEVIDATGGIFGDDPYATHYGVTRPAYMDALAAAKAALTAAPPPAPEVISDPAPAPTPAPAPAPQPVLEPAPAPEPAPIPVTPPVSSITGAESGPGSAVGGPANFGTGAYTADAVDPSEVNPIDYSQFTGDVGNFEGTPESSALYGPKINIPTSVSQYVTDPVTGGMTTTYGPEMVAVSPIGALKMPARPVSIDIFDWLSTPTYGSIYSGVDDSTTSDGFKRLKMGGEVSGPFDGSVPRNAMIADEPHMLAYINQDEEALLRSFGGSGISGPGGIPSYPPRDLGVGAINSGKTYSGSDKAVSGGFDAAAATADDDKPSRSSIGPSGNVSLDAIVAAAQAAADNEADRADAARAATGPSGYPSLDAIAAASTANDDNKSITGSSGYPSLDAIAAAATSGDDSSNVTSAPVGEVDFTTIDPATGSQTPVATIDYGTGSDDDGYIAPVVYTAPPPPPPVYTDRRGNQYSSQAEADAADRAFAAQLALASASVRDDAGRLGFGVSDDEVDYLAGLRMDDGKVQPGFVPSSMLGGAGPAGLYSGIGGIGSGPASGAGVGVTPAPITSPDISTDVSRPNVGPEAQYEIDDLFGTGLGSDILSLATPSAATMYPYDVPSSVLADQLRGGPLTPGMALPDAGDIKPYDFAASTISADMPPGLLPMNTPREALDILFERSEGRGASMPGYSAEKDLIAMAAYPDSRYMKNILDEVDYESLMAPDLPLTDDDMGLPSGPVTDLQRGLGNAGIIAARDADMDPFGTGTQLSLQDVKDRVARAEGTADEGGYGRLLGGQEGRFDVDLTNMTVQEVLDFQKQRGPGSYAEYSQGVNEQRGEVRDDGTGKISTPAGKYQIVGATLEDLVKNPEVGVSLDDKFDAATQEKLGSYLIAERRGLNDLQAGNITREQFEANLGKEFEGIARGLDKGAGSTALTIGAASETGRQAEVGRRDANVEKIKQQIGDQAEPTGGEALFYDFVGQLGFGLGKGFADSLRNASREERQAIIDQHLYALENGATPKTDEEGNYVGFDISTMDTFADKVLGAEDIGAFMPPSMAGGTFTVTQDMIDSLRASGLNAQADALTVGQKLNLPTTTNVSYQADADGDDVFDYDRFQQIYGAQSTAADEDPYGMSTEQGFITEDGREFFVDASGNVVEVTDSVVPFEPGGGEDVAAALGVTETTTGGDDDDAATAGPDTGHVDGVCNTEGYVYNPETDMCEPKKEEDTDGDLGSPITTGISPRSFDEVLRSVVVPAPRIAPISENIRPMQGGGMAGLNRAADNFLKALAG